MNNALTPAPTARLRPVGIAPIEKFFLGIGIGGAITAGILWREPVLVFLILTTTFSLTAMFAVWRVASYIIGMLADLAPAFRRMKQVGLLD